MNENSSAVVTGAGNGIGRGIALALAERGYRVIAADLVLAEAERVADEIRATGGSALPFRCDVTNTGDVEAMADDLIPRYGVPRLVFSNAGVLISGKSVLETTKDDLRWILDVNLLGAWDVARVFAKAAIEEREDKGEKAPMRIVFTGSEHSLGYPHPGAAAYTASKHALLAIAEAFRAELAGQVAVSVFCPGLTQSRIWDGQRHRAGHAGSTSARGSMLIAHGRDALEVGRLVVERAERGDFYIVSHPHAKAYASRRWSEIEAAFDSLERDHPGIPSYDVEQMAARLQRGSGNESR
ncbi:MAG: SDR family NAD(P)-dependent oxidoreductase [Burkholderiaceae bacterium]